MMVDELTESSAGPGIPAVPGAVPESSCEVVVSE